MQYSVLQFILDCLIFASMESTSKISFLTKTCCFDCFSSYAHYCVLSMCRMGQSEESVTSVNMSNVADTGQRYLPYSRKNWWGLKFGNLVSHLKFVKFYFSPQGRTSIWQAKLEEPKTVTYIPRVWVYCNLYWPFPVRSLRCCTPVSVQISPGAPQPCMKQVIHFEPCQHITVLLSMLIIKPAIASQFWYSAKFYNSPNAKITVYSKYIAHRIIPLYQEYTVQFAYLLKKTLNICKFCVARYRHAQLPLDFTSQ